ncbi:MAG TPA: hypothetical protein VFQ53_11900 [Kofleriaceae bacterium]|nr:hypothetical protein [Kofleriaceae bacterium]
MATDDDDLLTAPVPEPDAEPTAAERKRAKMFADLIDRTLAGRTPPPAMSADDRALLEVATVIRAASGGLELPASTLHAVVEDSLKQGMGGGAGTSLSSTPITSARQRRWVPWTIAAVSSAIAAAAILLLWLRTPVHQPAPQAAAQIPATWKSRPADPLIGPIEPERAGDASARIDTIFADRLEGYRERRLSRLRGRADGATP